MGRDLDSLYIRNQGFPGGSVVKNSPANTGDAGLIPGLGRSPGEGNGNPLQYYSLGNPMDRGGWRAIVLGVTKESKSFPGTVLGLEVTSK